MGEIEIWKGFQVCVIIDHMTVTWLQPKHSDTCTTHVCDVIRICLFLFSSGVISLVLIGFEAVMRVMYWRLVHIKLYSLCPFCWIFLFSVMITLVSVVKCSIHTICVLYSLSTMDLLHPLLDKLHPLLEWVHLPLALPCLLDTLPLMSLLSVAILTHPNPLQLL